MDGKIGIAVTLCSMLLTVTSTVIAESGGAKSGFFQLGGKLFHFLRLMMVPTNRVNPASILQRGHINAKR